LRDSLIVVQGALKAIASPTRRTILELLWDAERPSSDIAALAGLSRPAASQHLRVLRQAGLVTVRAVGSSRLYRTRVDRIAELRTFLEGFWGPRLDAMRMVAEDLHRGAVEDATASAQSPEEMP
jgi:DNA-binding transcriptional ArsR family regulator